MTSVSDNSFAVNVVFFRDGEEVYGEKGLIPATEYSVGIDLRACLADKGKVTIDPGERYPFGTGIAIAPKASGVAGFIYSRSGLGAKTGLAVAQGVGIIDPDYRGELIVFLYNSSNAPQVVAHGDRIAQLVFHSFFRGEFLHEGKLDETSRGVGGFGHTGK